MSVRKLEALVERVRVETPDTVTLFFSFEGERVVYKAGQFCTIDPHQFPLIAGFTRHLEILKGKHEPTRAYSLCSAPHEDQVGITIKEELYVPGTTLYPPLLSPYLVHGVSEGDRLFILGFTGNYVLPDDIESKTDHIVHVVAGSGSVPNFGILKDSLKRHPKLRHTFLYSNKTWDDICFRAELEALESAHPDRLTVVHALTREPDKSHLGPKVREGRVSLELFREFIPHPSSCWVYACGPAITPWERRRALETQTMATPRFMETAIGHLRELGIPNAQIKREAYG